MPLTDGLQAGGVFIKVKLDTSGLAGDLRDAQRKIQDQIRKSGVSVPVGSSRMGGGSAAPAIAPSMPGIGAMAGAFASALSPAVSAVRQTSAAIQSQSSAQIPLLRQIARNTAVTSVSQRSQILAGNDFRRITAQGEARASLNRRLNFLTGGRFNLSTDRNRFINRRVLPESRFLAGIGFDPEEPSGPSGPSGAADSLDRAGKGLNRAAVSLSRAALSLSRVGRASAIGAAVSGLGSLPPLPKFPTGGGLGPMFAGTPGETGDPVSRIGITPQLAAMGVQPMQLQRRGKNKFWAWQRAFAGGPRQPGFGQGSPRSGSINASGLRGVGSLLGMFGRGSAAGLGGAAALGSSAAQNAIAAIGSAAAAAGPAVAKFALTISTKLLPFAMRLAPVLVPVSVAVLGIKNTFNLALAPVRIFGNALRSLELRFAAIRDNPITRFLGSSLSKAFRGVAATVKFAGASLGIFDRNLGLVGNVAKGLGSLLAAPFRLALAPVRLLTGAIRTLGMSIALLGPLALAAFVGKGVMAAVKMNETVNVANQTFGGFSQRVQSGADAMAERFGLVEESMLESANLFGLLLTGMGVAEDRAAGLSTRLAQLSADMSSFFNVSQEEAAGAIQSALRGQFRPISRFGAVIRREDVTALAEMRGEATRTGEAMATLDLIFRGLAPAVGDLARTMNSPANLMRELRGRIQNLAGEIGAELVPAFREILLLFNDLLSNGTGLGQFVQSVFSRIGDGAQLVVRRIRQMAAAWPETLELFKIGVEVIRDNFSSIAKWIGDILINAISAAIGLVFDIMKAGFTALRDALQVVWEGIGADLVSTLSQAALDAAKNLTKAFTNPVGAALDMYFDGEDSGQKIDRAFDQAKEKAQNIISLFDGLNIPALKLEIPQAIQDRIDELIATITGTEVRGEGDEGNVQRAPGRLRDAVAEGVERARSTSGRLVGAEELRNLQQQSVFEREQRELQRQTARGVQQSSTHLATIAAAVTAGGGTGGLVAVAAP